MGLGRSTAVVLGRSSLGESDRIVTFFSRGFGKVRGVARSARRLRSRFGSALEPFTLGDLVFFDTGRSDLVRIDHFDIVRPFDRLREDLGRLGGAAWIVECVGRLTAERDANPALFGLLVRALRSVEAGIPSSRVTVAFGLRFVDALGHRLRVEACVGCGRPAAALPPVVSIDVDAGGVLCAACGGGRRGAVRVAAGTVAALKRLRGLAWAEATTARLGRAERELRDLLETHVVRLAGQPIRTSRFIREIGRAAAPGGEP